MSTKALTIWTFIVTSVAVFMVSLGNLVVTTALPVIKHDLGAYFAPVANLVLSTVRRSEEGKASGVNNTVREAGGVFGVAVLASVFSAVGGYATPQLFVDGMTAALWVGAAAVALAGIAAIAIPPRQDVVPDSMSLLERSDSGDGVEACEPEAAA